MMRLKVFSIFLFILFQCFIKLYAGENEDKDKGKKSTEKNAAVNISGMSNSMALQLNPKSCCTSNFYGESLQAHHLIPLNILKSAGSVLDKAMIAGFNFSGAMNGMLLGPPVHIGNHPSYDRFVQKLLTTEAYNTWLRTHPGKMELDYLNDRVVPQIRTFINHCINSNLRISINEYAKQLGN